MPRTLFDKATLFDKVWDRHIVVAETDAQPATFYIDLHLIHEVTSPQAFTELETVSYTHLTLPTTPYV